MDEYQSNQLQQIDELKQMKEKAEAFLKTAPAGKLRIAKSHGKIQYYHRLNPDDNSGRYIKKSDFQLAQQLAQKDYAEKILLMAKKKTEVLQVSAGYEYLRDFMEIFEQLSFDRRYLVNPYIAEDETYIEAWEKQKYEEKVKCSIDDLAQLKDDMGIFTEKGERVRSKSEKILADKLYAMGIPYVYECPLLLKGFGYVRPDFTVLNKRTRKELYWEHLGMMGQEEYCIKSIKKIELYEKNGFYPGKKLIITYEANDYPLNIKLVEHMINEYLL